MAHVIEQNPRWIGRISRPQLDLSTGRAAHGSGVRLKAMTLCGRLAVIAHGNRQKVILDVGIIHAGGRANKRTAFELIAGSGSGAIEKPTGADISLAHQVPVSKQANGLRGGGLNVEFQMILQILAHTRTVRDHRNLML